MPQDLTSTEGRAALDGAELWYRITGSGTPVVQIHGAGFGHNNLAPATPHLAEHFTVVDYDQRGYGQSDRPLQDYSIETWADDIAGLLDALDMPAAHIHGTSMGGMVATVFAGKYPERTRSVVINCAVARLGRAGRLQFQNWIDIVDLDPAGVGSRLLAEFVAWQALSRAFLESPDGASAVDDIQTLLRDSNDLEVFKRGIRAILEADLTSWLARITSPALVLGGDEDIMTPWDQGPSGVGQQGIFEGIPNAQRAVIAGSSHSTIFDNSAEHIRIVREFFLEHDR